MKFKSDIEVQAGLKDSSGSAGSSGQILTSTGTQTFWVTAPITPGTGGSSQVFYFNGSIASSVAGYKQMSPTAYIGTGTDFSINANGYIASFLTDVNSPNQLNIPAGNWNFEIYMSASSGGGSPSFYVELYKYSSSTFTLIASSSATPEGITNGTVIDLYTTALAVPATALLVTDRLAVRVYVLHSNKTITMHTEDSHLCEVITTFSTGISALNGLTPSVQYFATNGSGADFNIVSSGSTHTFNLPTASAVNRGALSSTDWTAFNNKQNALTNPITGTGTPNYIPKFTGTSTTLGNSSIYNAASGNIILGGTTDDGYNKLQVIGNGYFSNYLSVGNIIYANSGISVQPDTLGVGFAGNYVDYSIFNTGSDVLTFAVSYGGNPSIPFMEYEGGTLSITARTLIGATDDGINKLQVNGYVKATGYRIPSGLSTQFLKADGSVDSSTYLTTSSASTTYAPISGSANYIQNQNASEQSANMWINGTIQTGSNIRKSYNLPSPIPNSGNVRYFVQITKASDGTSFISGKIIASSKWSYAAAMGVFELETGVYVAQNATAISNGTSRVSSRTSTAGDAISISDLTVVGGYTGFYVYLANTDVVTIVFDGIIEGTQYWTTTNGWENTTFINRTVNFEGAVSSNSSVSATSFNSTLGSNFATSSGSVGIGTTSPSGILHLASGSDMYFKMSRANGSFASQFYRNASDGSLAWQSILSDNTTAHNFIVCGEGDSSHATTKIVMQPQGGNVGIGTTTPTEKLEVNGNLKLTGTSATNLFNATFTNNSTASNTTKSSSLLFRLSDTVGNIKDVATITCFNKDIDVIDGGLLFKTRTADAQVTALTLAGNGAATFSSSVTAKGDAIINYKGGQDTSIRLDQDGIVNWWIRNQLTTGKFIIGSNSTDNKFSLDYSTGAATFASSVTATGFFNSSDSRLKDIISQDGDTVEFTWKDKRDDKKHIGYIAQEVQKTYPDQVSEGSDGMLSVNYIEILVAKIQALESRIKILEK